MEREARRAVTGSMWKIREHRTAHRPLLGHWEQSKGNKLKASWKGLGRGWLWGHQWEQLWTTYTVRPPSLQDTPPVPPAADLGCPYSKLSSSLWRSWFPYPKKPASLSCSLHSNPGLLLLYLRHGLSVPPPQTLAATSQPSTSLYAPTLSPHPPFPWHCPLWLLRNPRLSLLLFSSLAAGFGSASVEPKLSIICSRLLACTLFCA